MPFQIVRNDITKMHVDAIVNTANPQPVIGPGTDAMIHAAAGPELLNARQQTGYIGRGSAAITPAFALQARYVIHTVGAVWTDGTHGEEALLRSCYDTSLTLALEHNCRSIAFPLICAGNYGFPKDKALQVAIAAFSEFLMEHEIQIYLVVFNQDAYKLSEKLFCGVASYIDEHYVAVHEAKSCRPAIRGNRAEQERPVLQEERRMAPCAPTVRRQPAPSLNDFLKKKDAGFTETLLKLIDKSGQKDSVIYKRANLSKQHFSKIRNNPDYRPTKPTAIALALALELDLAGTKDLIGRAGYALTDSSTFDLIIRYFIENRQHDVIEINIALYEFDQPLLGA